MTLLNLLHFSKVQCTKSLPTLPETPFPLVHTLTCQLSTPLPQSPLGFSFSCFWFYSHPGPLLRPSLWQAYPALECQSPPMWCCCRNLHLTFDSTRMPLIKYVQNPPHHPNHRPAPRYVSPTSAEVTTIHLNAQARNLPLLFSCHQSSSQDQVLFFLNSQMGLEPNHAGMMVKPCPCHLH